MIVAAKDVSKIRYERRLINLCFTKDQMKENNNVFAHAAFKIELKPIGYGNNSSQHLQ